MTTEERWEKFVACNNEVFGAIYEQHYRGWVNISYKMLKSMYLNGELAFGDAEDVVQQVLLEEVYHKKQTRHEQIRAIDKPLGYIRRAVSNRTLNRIEQIKLHRSKMLAEVRTQQQDHLSRGVDLGDGDIRDGYEAVLSGFASEERTIWRKVREEQWPIEQVAHDHNWNRRQVERIVTQIENALRKAFGY